MSELAKKALKKGKPPVEAMKNYNNSDSDDEETKDTFDAETKMPSQLGAGPGFGLPKSKSQTDFSPLPWSNFFDRQEFLEDGTAVYIAGGDRGPAFICLHGAGHSAQSFACLAGEVKKFATLVAFDFRGHGDSRVKENVDDLSAETLIKDSIRVFEYVEKTFPNLSIVVIGHSMGGSVATKAIEVTSTMESLSAKIQGLIVIDVVEGTAIEALPFMESIVKKKPPSFPNLASAIQWAHRSGNVKDVTSARVSIPPQLVEVEKPNGTKEYVWKVDLMKSQAYWMGWFQGLTQSFLNVRVAKILLLAGAERMDKELTIAQMQGKFRLKVIYDVGHSIQEDNWKETAKLCYEFLHSFRIPINAEEMETVRVNGIGTFHPNLPKNPFE